MITDSFFQQGHHHEICEDYMIHDDNGIYGSDGCSNGGGPSINSDWGSRFLCHAAKLHAADLKINQEDSQRIITYYIWNTITSANYFRTQLPNLPIQALTATLLALHKHQEAYQSIIVGDGICGARKKDGTWKICSYEYLPGGTSGKVAPFYPIYLLDNQASNYFKCFGGKVKKITYDGSLQGVMNQKEEEFILQSEHPWFHDTFSTDEFDLAFIGTDGWQTFQELCQTETIKTTNNIGLIPALAVLLDLPKSNQGFLRRQRQWIFKRKVTGTYNFKNWQNFDDVSCGVIHE